MKNAIVGLLAIPLILAILTTCNCAQACVGGASGKTYLEQNMTAPAGQYVSKEFKVDKLDMGVDVGRVTAGRLYVLSDTEMSNLSAGKNFTSIYNSSKQGQYSGRMSLSPGKYWVVLDNRASTSQASTDVLIYRPGDKCGASGPLSVPGYEGSMFILALMAVLAVGLRKRFVPK
jgi:hypothetical protein